MNKNGRIMNMKASLLFMWGSFNGTKVWFKEDRQWQASHCFEIVANGTFKGCLCETELAAGLMNEKKSKEIKSTNVLVFLR